jgi:ElaB/YqjD/DUF883 family membrane-anchored ribosome-binding protein
MVEFNRPGRTPVQLRHSDLGSSSERQESGMGSAVGSVSEKARELTGSASEMATEARDKVQQWASCAAAGAEDAWEDVSNWVRNNPVPTLFIVAGVGLLLALALTAGTAYAVSSERRYS